KAVRRGAPNTFMVVDVPFGAVGISEHSDLENAIALYKQTSANAIKVEGAHLIDFIKNCNHIGLPVVSHLGLTPQRVGITGYKMKATTKERAQQLINEAYDVQQAGDKMLVLEAVPRGLAAQTSKHLDIPVIGIGAGKNSDGQVFVYHDVLKYEVPHQDKFVKQYRHFSIGITALIQYHKEVKNEIFPDVSHTYKKQIMDEVSE